MRTLSVSGSGPSAGVGPVNHRTDPRRAQIPGLPAQNHFPEETRARLAGRRRDRITRMSKAIPWNEAGHHHVE